jgi:hypothetical protein
MENEAYSGVYADLSYHTDMMGEPGLEEHYLQTLNDLLSRQVVKNRVLFGTDSWLLRLNMSDDLFWSYFREKLSDEEFQQIASVNPKAFLGIDPLKKNVERYIGFQKKNRENVGSQPNRWLFGEVDAGFKVKRDHPNWTTWKYPALIVLASMGSQMYSKQKEQAFARKAFITMQELKFWNFKFVDEQAFEQECKKLSLDLVNQCEKEGNLEGDWTLNEARQKFEEMIRSGATRFLDLSFQIDVMYSFDYDSDE